MTSVKGPLYRLKTNWLDLDRTRSPLFQTVERYRLQRKSSCSSSKSSRTRPASAAFDQDGNLYNSKLVHNVLLSDSSFMKIKGDEPLGCAISDWKQTGFELSMNTCDLIYHLDASSGNEEETVVSRTGSLGYIQADTTISEGPLVETVDRNVKTTEKLRLYTFEIKFQTNNSIFPTHCVLGHPESQERDRWLVAIRLIIERKIELQEGWQQYCHHHIVGDARMAEQWVKMRGGGVGVQLNVKARRRARLQNGKVMQDVPLIFDKYSEECDEWPTDHSPSSPSSNYDSNTGEDTDTNNLNLPPVNNRKATKVMDTSRIIEAMAELGLELPTKVSTRMLEELHKNPPCQDVPGRIDLKHFVVLFQTCRQEMMVSPSAEMKQQLMRIMQDSKNPFLSLLSPMEQTYLIEGKDAEGRNVCTCKTFAKGTVLVTQNDEGDSMFLVIDGALSVIVTFGAGAAAIQREVAVLAAGAVMGEMSLVLGKPRSATCVVKSESAAVAEIAKSAMIRLLQSRPSLARELEEIVYRRDASNYVTAGKAGNSALNIAQAMAAYRKRAADAGPGPGAAGGGGSKPHSTSPDSAEDGLLPAVSKPVHRIVSRVTKAKLPPRAASAGPAGAAARGGSGGLTWAPSLGSAPPPAGPGAPRVKTGRWVKCKGVYMFLAD